MTIMTAPDKPKNRHRTFLVRDFKAAIKAAKGAGGNYKVTVDRYGTISVVPLAPGEAAKETQEADVWDKLLKE